MHLRTRRTRLGTGGGVFGPEPGVGKLFGQVFGNRQGIGDGAVFGFQQRDFPGRRMLEQPFTGVWLVELDQFFGVGGAGQIEGQGAAQGPGGIQFVADDQVISSCSGVLKQERNSCRSWLARDSGSGLNTVNRG